MAEDYFPSGSPGEDSTQGTSPPLTETDETKPEQEMEKEGGATALLPKSVLGGKDFQPGEEVVLKVVKVHEDEVEVEYATGEKGEGTKPQTADQEIDQMEAANE